MNKYNIDEVLLDLTSKKDLINKAKQKYSNVDYAYNQHHFYLISKDILNNNDIKIKYRKKSGYIEVIYKLYKQYNYKETTYIIPYFYDKDLECNIYACLPYLYEGFSDHLLTDQLDFKLFEYISLVGDTQEFNIYDTILPEKILSKKVINKVLKKIKSCYENTSFLYIENGNKYFTSKIRDKLQNSIFE